MQKFSIGCDPELFLYNTVDEEFISAEGLLTKNDILGRGTKKNPLIIAGEFFTLQEDNILLEYTIEPANSIEQFVEYNMMMFDVIQEFLPNNVITKNIPSATVDWKYLGSKQTMEAGCDEDCNAWLGCENPRPDITRTNLRTAGGHIHIGIDLDDKGLINLIKKLDILVGVPSVIIDQDSNRRLIYGRAGAHRIGKKYKGVEWRVPSNFWVQPDKLAWMYDSVAKAIVSDIDVEKYGELAVEIINNNDVNKAYELCNTVKECADFLVFQE